MICLAIIVTFLTQTAWSYNSELDPYQFPDSTDSYLYPEEYPDDEDLAVYRRASSNFLRFGRGGGGGEGGFGGIGDESMKFRGDSEESTRPTRSGNPDRNRNNNDYFIRLGRSKPDYLRFGRNANHLRFGRSASPTGNDKKRNKREVYPEFKRASSNYLRFGRNSNFLRFGRNDGGTPATPEVLATKIKGLEPPLAELFNALLKMVEKQREKCRGAGIAA